MHKNAAFRVRVLCTLKYAFAGMTCQLFGLARAALTSNG